MIEQAGLSVVFVQDCSPPRSPEHRYFYVGVMRAGDARPPWTQTL